MESSIVVKMEQWRCEMLRAFEEVAQDSDDELQEMFLATIDQDSSDSNEEVKWRGRGGSRMGREFVHRDKELWHEHLVKDYFAPTPTFDHVKFRRQFRMRREFFMRIVESITAFDSYFVQKCDALGRLGMSPLQKCTLAIIMLAYGVAADATDEYFRLGESTVGEAMRRFVNVIHHCFEVEYLILPTEADLKRLIEINTE